MVKRQAIPSFRARAGGHQFVVYGDSCSGIGGARNEANLGEVNAAIDALDIKPDFICFLGDEIMGLASERAALRRQWRHFFEREMAWLDRQAIPLYHCAGNHTVYDAASAEVFREAMAHLPLREAGGLSYCVRRGELLLVFLDTLDLNCGGEGAVDISWLERALAEHADARQKLVFGHHPVFPVNGFGGDYQRQIERETGRRFWAVLRRHGALAYFCSHILAFDAQVREGILQICTAGAGTDQRMPEGLEYLHFVQAALDESGLRYQAIDRRGEMREWLCWDWRLPASETWARFERTSADDLSRDCLRNPERAQLIVWEIKLRTPDDADHSPRMLLRAEAEGGTLPGFWLGIAGVDRRLAVLLSPQANRSPHRWLGPALPAGRELSIQVALHSGMGPGGLLWRWNDDAPWSSMLGASAWGPERLAWSGDWLIGELALELRWHYQEFAHGDSAARSVPPESSGGCV